MVALTPLECRLIMSVDECAEGSAGATKNPANLSVAVLNSVGTIIAKGTLVSRQERSVTLADGVIQLSEGDLVVAYVTYHKGMTCMW